jgi:hypothetical protein
VKYESIDKKKEVKAQRDDESTNEDHDEYTSEHEFFLPIQRRYSHVI